MGLRAGQVVQWSANALTLLLGLSVAKIPLLLLPRPGESFQDAVHITAILGESVVFNCHVEFPSDHPVPYVLQWEKKVGDTGSEIPIYIWYDGYPTHSGEGYEGRVSRVTPDSPYGLASLNLTNIQESDQGWYECKVVFLNRPPKPHKNGTWFHLDVHAPPRFSVTPDDTIYVSLGNDIILNCQAEGTPTPEILWYKDANPVEPSVTVGIFNDDTELRISNIRHEDIGDFTCIARNGEGQISHTARVIIAGGPVIVNPPQNQTKLEGDKVEFGCSAKANPGNVTVRWFWDGVPVKEVSALETRVTVRRDGSLIVNPVSADDSGQYTCEVSNGIGEPQTASAYLNVEYPAKVTFTPTVQYLPFRLAGVVQCYIKANPPLQYVTWSKDRRLLEPYQSKDIVIMNNGSLLFTRVNLNHQGQYTCTPYNQHSTQGPSGPMDVLVRKPPVFTIEPENFYQRKVGDTVEMHCEAQEGEGVQKLPIQWQRRDGAPLPRNRVKLSGGNITIEALRRSDFGFYQCVASNDVATIVIVTQLVVEGTQPHAPYNVSGNASEFAVTLQWLPGYSGGPDYKQDYTIWYREAGISNWSSIPVTPSGSTQVTINQLQPGTTYEFQVVGKNILGDGMLSKVITVRTLDGGITRTLSPIGGPNTNKDWPSTVPPDINDSSLVVLPTDSSGGSYFPPVFRPKGPRPGHPRNLTVTEISNGFVISWQTPVERPHLVQHYTIKYKTDGPWKTLNHRNIRPEETSFLVKSLVGARTYYFRVLANSVTSYESSEEVKYSVPARVKHKAITAGVVGGILFFIVAIILSVCAVKICNKRKRRRQEKAYNMVACRVTDARNGGQAQGASQVPLKKLRQSRVSSVSRLLTALGTTLGHGRFQENNWRQDVLSRNSGKDMNPRLGQISRAADGRFVLVDSTISSVHHSLNSSSSDDGGFLPRRRPPRPGRVWVDRRSSWRRPLVTYPSELSLRSEGSGQSAISPSTIFTPIRHTAPPAPPRLLASSPTIPTTPASLLAAAWSPAYNFSDLSSVRQPSSADRSLPSASTFSPASYQPSYQQLRSIHEKYSQELPSLRAIHQDFALNKTRMPLVVPAVHPPLATSSPPRVRIGWGSRGGRSLVRHVRHARSAPELAASDADFLETSPSSSSGFGSKNTSQQNQSSHSGSTSVEWRLPPYRPPPPPPPISPPPPLAPLTALGHYNWLEFNTGLSCLPSLQPLKSTPDASVDGHYEFDSVLPPTPTGKSTSFEVDTCGLALYPSTSRIKPRLIHALPPSKYDNIEARVQAMKEEFHQFRKRQAQRRRSHELESAC